MVSYHLEDSIVKYEKAVELIEQCNKILENAQGKLKKIKEGIEGPEESDFE